MSQQAKGTFEITRHAEPTFEPPQGGAIARVRFDKIFEGPLTATSSVLMLAVGNPSTGSAGYVAMEVVEGTLDGKRGRFALQHSATMNEGAPSLTLTVVPDSGTDALATLSGRMSIDIALGKHFYTFDYTL